MIVNTKSGDKIYYIDRRPYIEANLKELIKKKQDLEETTRRLETDSKEVEKDLRAVESTIGVLLLSSEVIGKCFKRETRDGRGLCREYIYVISSQDNEYATILLATEVIEKVNRCKPFSIVISYCGWLSILGTLATGSEYEGDYYKEITVEEFNKHYERIASKLREAAPSSSG